MVVDLRSRKRASVASVVGDPQNLNGQLATTVSDRQPESSPGLEIGSLFVKAQRFADETAREAERKAQEVIFAAEAKAAEIIQRATAAEWAARAKNASDQAEEAAITEHDGQQAGAITPQTQAQVPAEAIATLSAAIEEFADANRTLSAELVKLRLALGESSAAVSEGQHLHPEDTALTSNSSNGALLLPSSG
jgi:hypothetical protein